MTIIRGLFFLILVAAIIIAVLFVDFTYKTFSLRQRDVKTDAIVVLAGGRGRVEEGLKLYRQGKGEHLFLIGVDPSVRKGDLFRERKGEQLGERVYLEKVSRNTLENAIYGRDILMSKKVTSVLLITSRYHMKRATLIFRNALPRDIAIYSHPVDTSNLKGEWWSHRGSFRLLFSEFYKYCLFRLFFLLAPGELRPLAGVS